MKQGMLWAVVLVGLALLGRGPAGAQDTRPPTVKEIMDRLHKGAYSPIVLLKKELQAPEPPWEEVRKTSQDFVELGKALVQDDPPRGDRASWERLAGQYLADAQAMDAAVQRQNRPAALAARDRLAASCAACHQAHK